MRITDEECLDYNIDDGYVEEQGEISLREKMFSKRYCFSMKWKSKIEVSHRISINIVEEKDSDFFNKSNPTKKLFEKFDLESQKKKHRSFKSFLRCDVYNITTFPHRRF